MPTVSVADTTIYYDVVGDGPPLLVCHGGPGLGHDLYRTLEPLLDGVRLVFWDHRGHGRSGRPARETLTMARFADDAAALASHLGLARAHVLGHSFGGWVATELALRHPDLVESLSLVATTPGQLGTDETGADTQGPPPPAEVTEIMGRTALDDEAAVSIYRDLAPWYARTADPDLVTAHVADADAVTMRAVFEALSGWSAVDRLGSIRCPTLVLVGRDDVFCSFPQSERIARRVPGADLVVLGDCGHMVWLERPEAFRALVRDRVGA